MIKTATRILQRGLIPQPTFAMKQVPAFSLLQLRTIFSYNDQKSYWDTGKEKTRSRGPPQSRNFERRNITEPRYQSPVDPELSKEDLQLQKYINNEETINQLKSKGITEFFQIQAKTFQIISRGEDLIACDRTGSGKTMAFSLPIIEKMRKNGEFLKQNKAVKFLILAPTRELAIQINQQIASLRNEPTEFRVVPIYGGASKFDQRRLLRKMPSIIVATPGRAIDFYEAGQLQLSQVQTICLDEADYMLERGFKDDVQFLLNKVFSTTASKPQMLLFSATMPNWIKSICERYMSDTKKQVKMFNINDERTATTVKHMTAKVNSLNRAEGVMHLIKKYSSDGRVLIFTNTKADANYLRQDLKIRSVVLHSDFDQELRQFRLNKFKEGEVKVLIATDVAARGLDIPNVELVIQVEPPVSTENYIHRSGRTGRAGKEGICVTMVGKNNTKDEMDMLKIRQMIKKTTFQEITISDQDLQEALAAIEEESLRQEQTIEEQDKHERLNFKMDKKFSERRVERNYDFDGWNIFIMNPPDELSLRELYRLMESYGLKNMPHRSIMLFHTRESNQKLGKIMCESEEQMYEIMNKKMKYADGTDVKMQRSKIFKKKTYNN